MNSGKPDIMLPKKKKNSQQLFYTLSFQNSLEGKDVRRNNVNK